MRKLTRSLPFRIHGKTFVDQGFPRERLVRFIYGVEKKSFSHRTGRVTRKPA